MPENLLVIDDEKGIVALCDRLLSRAGFTVKTATDPEDGLNILDNESFDLLLVDIRMPKMDGFQVIEAARLRQPDMGVVIMTGFGTLETAIRALREGADGLILKPFEEGKELVETVQRAIEERQHKREMARMRAIRPLLDMTENLFSETRKEALIDLIIKAICGHLRCDHAGIYQRLSGEKNLKLLGGAGITLPEEQSHSGSGLVGQANFLQSPVLVNFDGPGDQDLQSKLTELKLGAAICVPVSGASEDLVFYAGRSPGDPVFQAADVDLFGILARQALAALENARLYGELRAYVHQVEDSQRALAQAEKMAAVGRLTASIAHEVNNPLQSVRNCLHLAEREELSEKEREDYYLLAKEELERLMQTVRRMLDFYRPGAIEREQVMVGEIVERVLKLLGKQLEQQNVRVESSFPSDIPALTVASNQIQQVFFNLILNAMDVLPDGGVITINAKNIDDRLEIYFQDDGPGVQDEKAQEIFEPFVSTREDGSGLGLSVSYGILTAHGGSLDLLPGNGKGACFRVTLPIKEK
ncbi:MAG: response regulator [Anaerolineae bacterium]|nr:response regulator [Anaerolineae bacterium]